MKRGPKTYFIELIRELKKVTWPAPRETTRLFGIVLAVCLMVVVILTTLSLGVDVLIKGLTKGF